MGIESASRHDQWPLLGVGYPTDYPTGQRGGISHHNTAHGPMKMPPEFVSISVAACRVMQRSILRQEFKLIGATFLRDGGMLMAFHSGFIPHEMRVLARHDKSMSDNDLFGAALTSFVLSIGIGVYLTKLGASLIASIQESLRNDRARFEKADCGRILTVDSAAREVAARRAHRFEALDLATDLNSTTAMVGMEGHHHPQASWGKTVVLGVAAALTTIVAAAAIAEDFFPVVGGPINDAPAVAAATTSWRLYLACF